MPKQTAAFVSPEGRDDSQVYGDWELGFALSAVRHHLETRSSCNYFDSTYRPSSKTVRQGIIECMLLTAPKHW
jgi:hypothetical protein